MKPLHEMSFDEQVALAARREANRKAGRPLDSTLPPEIERKLWIDGSPEAREADARLEKAIVAAADKQLRALGFIIVNFSQPRASKQTAGIPDHRFYHPARGLCFWWEAKSPTGEQSPAQRSFQHWCDATGDPYCLGTDQDLYRWLLARYPLASDDCGNLVWRTPR
jgi:hypothetical protein